MPKWKLKEDVKDKTKGAGCKKWNINEWQSMKAKATDVCWSRRMYLIGLMVGKIFIEVSLVRDVIKIY